MALCSETELPILFQRADLGGNMSIDAVLRTHQWRNGSVPEFCSEDIPSNENRWGRHRFDPTKAGGLVLPWIAMNPAGSSEGRSHTGERIYGWSWHWGFDRCVVYNVRPHKDPDSNRANRTSVSDADINASHDFIAAQLRDCDAVIVAWGSESGEQKGWAKRLLDRINAGRSVPIATWCLGTNKSGQPTHPGRRAKVPLTKQAEEWAPIFNRINTYDHPWPISRQDDPDAESVQTDELMSRPAETASEQTFISSVGNGSALNEAAHGFYLILEENPSLRWDRAKTRITLSNAERRLLRLKREGNVDLILHEDVVNLSNDLRAMMKPRKEKDFRFTSSDAERTKEVMVHARAAFRRLSRGPL